MLGGVRVGEFEKPNVLAAVYFVMEKNARLKLRSWKSTAVEVLLPVMFMIMLLPAYYAAGTDNYGNKQYLENHLDMDAHFKPWICRLNTQAEPMEYPPCVATPPEWHCLGNICLNSSVPDDTSSPLLRNLIRPLTTAVNSTTIPSFDIVALWRRYAQEVDLGDDVGRRSVENALGTGTNISIFGDPAVVERIDEWLLSSTHTYKYTKREFESEQAATDYASSKEGSSTMWAVIVMNSLTDYTIRMNYTSTPDTNIFTLGNIGYHNTYRLYLSGGFLTLQGLINANITGAGLPSSVIPMPVQGYHSNQFLSSAGNFLPLILTMAFLFPLSQIVSTIVREKEARIREAMLIMGLPATAFKLSWVVTTVLQLSITGLLLSIVVGTTFLNETTFGIVFMLFWSYCMSLAAAGIMLSVFFSKASLASLVSPMVYLLTAIPSLVLTNPGTQTQSMLSIFNTYAFGQAVALVYEAAGKGESLTWDTASDGSYSFSLSIGFMWIDTFVYLILAVWLDQILPSEWGAKKPLCYYCWPPYWFTSVSFSLPEGDTVDGVLNKKNLESITDPALLERRRIEITNLRKEFEGNGGSSKNVAVNNVNLSLYEGQILALLGHNGAGKTTLINMLTGMLPVTAGDAIVYGNSITHNLNEVRRDIGLCPQHNILWDNMTCAEHLRYYGRVKGIPTDTLEEHVDDILAKVELSDKKDAYSTALSGGMKRKLSVGIALMGGPKFIIFDEPTAGMDVQARRAIWDLLKAVRNGRTILLTTHFMDEADLLGDSIAILHGGRVDCWGSSFFLKQKLGVGYNLTMELAPGGADIDSITNTIKGEISPLKKNGDQDVELLSAAGSELAYRIPMWGLPNFAQMFELLETSGRQLGVKTFGMSVTTLEEIFIKIAHDHEAEEEQGQQRAIMTNHQQQQEAQHNLDRKHLQGIDMNPADRMQDKTLYMSQWHGLFRKRLQYSKRDMCTICFQLVLPVVVVVFALALSFGNSQLSALSLTSYGEDSIFPVAPVDSLFAVNGMIAGVTPMPDTFESPANMSDWLLHRSDKDNRCWQALFQPAADFVSPMSLFHNTSSMHSIPIAVNGFASAQYRQQTGGSTGISVVNHPLPYSVYHEDKREAFQNTLTAVFIMLPFCFIPANYVSFLVQERVSKSKHVQVVSGVKLTAYWLSNLCWDFVSFCLSAFLTILVFLFFGRDEYVGGGEAFIATVLLFVFYALTAIFAAYLASFFFTSATTGQNTVLLGNYFSGFALVITVSILDIIEDTQEVAKVLRYVFRVIPAFCLGDGLLALAQLPSQLEVGTTTNTPLSMDVVGWDILFLCMMFPVFATLSMANDFPQIWYMLRLKKPPSPDEDHSTAAEEMVSKIGVDDDVLAEKNAVLNGRSGDVVRVQRLRKVYPSNPPKVAVKEVSFGVKTDEIFAFLGTNGAGKTTTIEVLAGNFLPTSGCASIKGYDVVTEAAEAKRELGYCPQFDALLDLLTPMEHIALYAALRGVPMELRDEMSDGLIQVLGLQDHKNTVCKRLSGGNKRKTSIAISLIGGPSCILLDEPTAGMDPVARRGMWTALQSIGKGRCVVLTTHHLEEVEALAHRTAIMVDGRIQCLGSLSHLKHKFGGAYEVQVKVAPEMEEHVLTFFEKNFENSTLVEQTNHRLTYQLTAGQKLSQMFSTIEKSRKVLNIIDYSISETSLEQVFITICKRNNAA